MQDSTDDIAADSPVFRLLGRPASLISGAPKPFPENGYIILALLLFAPGNAMSRDAIAQLLWEDLEPGKAKANLRQCVRRMRTHIGLADVFTSDANEALKLGPRAAALDLARLLTLKADARLPEARDLLLISGHELLTGIDPTGEELTEWLRIKRSLVTQRYASLTSDVLEALTRFGSADIDTIDQLCERLILIDPENDDYQQVVERAYNRISARPLANRIGTQSLNAAIAEIRSGPTTVDRFPKVAFLNPGGRATDWVYRALIEDIANGLSRFRTFEVIAPYSTLAPEVRETVTSQVDYVILSTILPIDHSFTVSLREVCTGKILWSAEHEITDEQLIVSFRMISKHTALALANTLEAHRADAQRMTSNSDAYKLSLHGKHLLKQCDLPNLRRARKAFREAARSDEFWAEPRARIAQTAHLEWVNRGGTDPALLNWARTEAETAVMIDPFDATGHWMRAVVALYQRDYGLAAEKFQEAEALSPNSPDLLLEHADALSYGGSPELGQEKFQRALELNPMPPDGYWWSGASIAFALGNFHEALNLVEKMENDQPALRLKTAIAGHIGNRDLARSCAARLRERYPGIPAADLVRLVPHKIESTTLSVIEGLHLAGLE